MEAEENPQTTSLFPVLHHRPSLPAAPTGTGTGNSPAVPGWLNNSSFTTDLSLINDAVSSHYPTTTALQSPSDDGDVDVDVDGDDRKPTYDLVDSSASDRVSSDSDNDDNDDNDEERARKKRRKDKKKKKKRKRRERSTEAPAAYDYSFSRKSDVRHWASSSTSTPTDNDYYFDSRGDPDNLAFGCIYRMDIARYKLFNSTKDSEHNYRALFHWSGKRLVFDGDGDIDGLDAKIRSGGRYWSAKYAALERHKNLKRLRICAPRRYTMNGMVDDFIPLSDEASDAGSVAVVEESWEDKVLRKTREFNGMTRERPHDEKIWVAFAEFQDKVASMQPQKGARLQTLERKISILEKATELNPDNEDLLLALMNGYHSRDNTDVLIGRWEKLLMLHSGSCKLWREFLHVIQGEFSRFKVSEVRKMYANAIQALSAACSKLRRQVHDLTKTSVDPYVVEQELGLVDIFICLCRFEWQAGYQELATALFQAELEYSLFCPDLLLTEQSKQRLFEHFWNSSGARVGEDGAVGWSTWLGKEEEQKQKLVIEDSSDKVEEGGWTGWFEPLSKGKDISSNLDSDLAVGQSGDKMDDEQEDDTETRNKEQEDDTEALLKMLGIDADAAANSEIKDTKTWTRWSEEELSRDSNQWMPARVASSQNSHVHRTTEEDGDEQLVRVVLFEDVSEFLFSIVSDAARLSLVSQIVDFYGGKIAHWTCTNSSSWAEKTLSLEDLPASLLDDIKGVNGASRKTDPIPSSSSLEVLLHSSADTSMQIGMMKFLRNAILLCLTAFPENYLLEEAALVAEELVNTRMNSCSFMVTPCRALAKSLLKSNRQDVLLCAVYARREAFFGNMDHARKVFDMAISSTDGLPSDSRTNLYILYFWYAEVELANGSGGGSDSSMRAMHILSCLGSGTKYSTFKGQLSSLQQLRARQGFKERVKLLQSKWARGFVDDQSVALVCAAALFEELAAGWVAGVEILNEAFSMVLPERRRQSYHLEFLFNYYLCMLQRHLADLKLSKVWDSVVDRLQIYPNSPKLYNSLLQIGHLYTSPNKLRRIFDDHCQKRSSVIVWLFALSFEMSRGGSKHRIHALFERALANDKLHNSVVLWRCYISYEMNVSGNPSAARRIFFRAINACPWSKKLWLDGFLKLNSVLTVKELSDLQEVMRDKELNLRTDIYEILLQDEMEG